MNLSTDACALSLISQYSYLGPVLQSAPAPGGGIQVVVRDIQVVVRDITCLFRCLQLKKNRIVCLFFPSRTVRRTVTKMRVDPRVLLLLAPQDEDVVDHFYDSARCFRRSSKVRWRRLLVLNDGDIATAWLGAPRVGSVLGCWRNNCVGRSWDGKERRHWSVGV